MRENDKESERERLKHERGRARESERGAPCPRNSSVSYSQCRHDNGPCEVSAGEERRGDESREERWAKEKKNEGQKVRPDKGLVIKVSQRPSWKPLHAYTHTHRERERIREITVFAMGLIIYIPPTSSTLPVRKSTLCINPFALALVLRGQTRMHSHTLINYSSVMKIYSSLTLFLIGFVAFSLEKCLEELKEKEKTKHVMWNLPFPHAKVQSWKLVFWNAFNFLSTSVSFTLMSCWLKR